jgi:hypothetical protein
MSQVSPDLGVVIPEGWTLELLPGQPDHAMLSTPSSGILCMATMDFRARGIRSGYSTTSKFISEEWNRAYPVDTQGA